MDGPELHARTERLVLAARRGTNLRPDQGRVDGLCPLCLGHLDFALHGARRRRFCPLTPCYADRLPTRDV